MRDGKAEAAVAELRLRSAAYGASEQTHGRRGTTVLGTGSLSNDRDPALLIKAPRSGLSRPVGLCKPKLHGFLSFVSSFMLNCVRMR